MEESEILIYFDVFDRGDYLAYIDKDIKVIKEYRHKKYKDFHLIYKDGVYRIGINEELGGIFGHGSRKLNIITVIQDMAHLRLFLGVLDYNNN